MKLENIGKLQALLGDRDVLLDRHETLRQAMGNDMTRSVDLNACVGVRNLDIHMINEVFVDEVFMLAIRRAQDELESVEEEIKSL